LRMGVDDDEIVRCICGGVGRSDSCGARLRDGRSTVSRKVIAASFLLEAKQDGPSLLDSMTLRLVTVSRRGIVV
jgi:hypothetical protein